MWPSDGSSIEDFPREKLSPTLFGGEEINSEFWKILGHHIKHGGLGIPGPPVPADIAYNISKAASGELVDSFLGGTTLNNVCHRVCVHGAIADAIKYQNPVEMAELARQTKLAGVQERNRLHRAKNNEHGLAL